MCDRKVLLFMVLYLLLVVYGFFVNFSVGPSKPSWQYFNIETTATAYTINLFQFVCNIFDAMIVVIYDVNRSKYVMLVRNKREMLEANIAKRACTKTTLDTFDHNRFNSFDYFSN